jgi:hypothetical protein
VTEQKSADRDEATAAYERGIAALQRRDYEAAERLFRSLIARFAEEPDIQELWMDLDVREREQRRERQRTGGRPAGLDALVSLQAADGSWDLSVELARVIGRDLAEIEDALIGASGASSSVRRAWATALTLAWLELHADGWEDEWRLVGTKARNWTGDVDAVPPDRWTWSHAARRFLSV